MVETQPDGRPEGKKAGQTCCADPQPQHIPRVVGCSSGAVQHRWLARVGELRGFTEGIPRQIDPVRRLFLFLLNHK